MNVKRFTARTSREALAAVRLAFGDDAVVLSTNPCTEGVEVLAMAPESMAQIERVSAASPVTAVTRAAQSAAAPAAAARAPSGPDVTQDVGELAMSTLSFQSYVRERMLKRREAALRDETTEAVVGRTALPVATAPAATTASTGAAMAMNTATVNVDPALLAPLQERAAQREAPATTMRAAPALPGAGPASATQSQAANSADQAAARRDQQAIVDELRQVRGLIEDRFGALAFMDKLQRHPAHARLTQKLLDCGFSAALIRKLAENMNPAVQDETEWATGVLERNLATGEREAALEDQGGVYAFIGATGVGKTTSTAKLAAAFATKHGAADLGLITLDAYRVAAHEQLRAYGRILGVPVHTAHDKASLEDLLELLAAKKMVLIDTAGMAQRDSRTAELLDMLDHPSINKLLVLNAAAQGETLEDVIVSYRAPQARGVVLSKMDEAVKLAPALDAVIRHKLTVLGVANGQRVPEDWHRLPAQVLVHRALRATAWSAYRVEPADVPLFFTAPTSTHATAALHA
jgi:flagellar biosynthesis protein FlhF